MDSSVRKIKVDGHDFFGYVVPGSLVFATLVIALVSLWPKDELVVSMLNFVKPTPELRAFHYIALSITIILLCHVLGHIVATFSSLLFDRILIGKIIKLPHERFVAKTDLCCDGHAAYESALEVRDRESLTREEVKSAFSVIHYRVLFTLIFLAPLAYVYDACLEGWNPKPISLQNISFFNTICLVIVFWFGCKWLADGAWNNLESMTCFSNVFSSKRRKDVRAAIRKEWKETWREFKAFCGTGRKMSALLFIYAFTFVCAVLQIPLRLVCTIFEHLADQRSTFSLAAQLRFKDKYKKLFCVQVANSTQCVPSGYDQEIWWAVYWHVLTTNNVIRERVDKFYTLYRFMRNCGFACLLSAPIMGSLARESKDYKVLFFVIAYALWGFAVLFVLRYCYIYNEFFAKTVYRAFAFLPDPDPADKAICVYCQNEKRAAIANAGAPES
jgi:hypothetical protein